MESEKTGIDDLVYKAEIETQMKRTNIWIPRGKVGRGWRGMNWEIGIDIYILLTLCIKLVTNENLLYSTGNSTQCSLVTEMRRKSKKEGIYVYV